MANTHIVGETRSDPNVEGMLKIATLEDIYSACDDRVMLCLNLPLGPSSVFSMPRIRFVTYNLLMPLPDLFPN
jgi:hypothetical protein